MKTIKKEIKTYQEIYVSNDGKEFEKKEDCLEWEKSYGSTLAASFNEIKKVTASSVDLGLPWNSDDHEVYILQPKDLNEIAVINAYVDFVVGGANKPVTAQMIDKAIVINFGYDRDWCEVYELASHLENVRNTAADYISKLNGEGNEN